MQQHVHCPVSSSSLPPFLIPLYFQSSSSPVGEKPTALVSDPAFQDFLARKSFSEISLQDHSGSSPSRVTAASSGPLCPSPLKPPRNPSWQTAGELAGAAAQPRGQAACISLSEAAFVALAASLKAVRDAWSRLGPWLALGCVLGWGHRHPSGEQAPRCSQLQVAPVPAGAAL